MGHELPGRLLRAEQSAVKGGGGVSGPELTDSWWPAVQSSAVVDETAGTVLYARAQADPDVEALVGEDHEGREVRLTFAALYSEARRVALGLLTVAKPGDYVAVCVANTIEWPLIQYAAALSGIIVVAVNPSLRRQELAYVIGHSRSVALIHGRTSRGADLSADIEAARSSCPDLQTVISVGEIGSWQDHDPGFELPVVHPDSIAMLQYTSGTTGLPKGVLLTHRALVNNARFTMEAIGAQRGSICVTPLPMFHTAGCVTCTLGPLWLAGTMVLVPRPDAGLILDTVVRERPDVLFHVPAVLARVLAEAEDRGVDLPPVRALVGGASSVPPALVGSAESAFGAKFHIVYGQTELSSVLTVVGRDASRHDAVHSVGRPLMNVECKVIDPISGFTQPTGTSGEICARGYQAFAGYLHDPQATALAKDEDGWVHTGDLGVMDAHGTLSIIGRLKDVIIRGGENISPAEVESVLSVHAAVLEVAVIGLPEERLGECVAAVVKVRGGVAIDAIKAELRLLADEQLARHKRPTLWFFTDELPKTASGKIQKFQLQERIESGAISSPGRPSGSFVVES